MLARAATCTAVWKLTLVLRFDTFMGSFQVIDSGQEALRERFMG